MQNPYLFIYLMIFFSIVIMYMIITVIALYMDYCYLNSYNFSNWVNFMMFSYPYLFLLLLLLLMPWPNVLVYGFMEYAWTYSSFFYLVFLPTILYLVFYMMYKNIELKYKNMANSTMVSKTFMLMKEFLRLLLVMYFMVNFFYLYYNVYCLKPLLSYLNIFSLTRYLSQFKAWPFFTFLWTNLENFMMKSKLNYPFEFYLVFSLLMLMFFAYLMYMTNKSKKS